ncbi:MAG: hypothetical protein Alis3KO_41050 [Aliiglaciecola sp.]
MLKVRFLFVAGIALVIEGYFQFVRGLLPVGFFDETSGQEAYYKVVSVEEGVSADLFFYLLGILLIALALFLLTKVRQRT